MPDHADDIRISTRDIADETGKDHGHVCRDFKKMCDDIGLGQSKFGASYLSQQNKEVKHYLLPKDLAMTLITGYRADLRYKVVKRLEALEAEKREGATKALTGPELMAAALVEANSIIAGKDVYVIRARSDIVLKARATRRRERKAADHPKLERMRDRLRDARKRTTCNFI